MDRTYCCTSCERGIEVKNDLLARCDSMFDAVSDIAIFCNECSKTCDKVENKNEETVYFS